MIYCDDILNVNAYLRAKSRAAMEQAKAVADSFDRLEEEYAALNAQADAALEKAMALAASMGISVELPRAPEAKAEAKDCGELLIRLPKDMDFAAEFERLRQEAWEAGYRNVQPEELLSEEELRRAQEFQDQLDDRFQRETGLTRKDMAVLVIGTAVRIACYYLFSRIMAKDAEEETAGEQEAVGELVHNAGQTTSTVSQAAKIVQSFGARKTKTAAVKPDRKIIADTIPFDLPDNAQFLHRDVLGFHPYLGWVFGVMNIMTDTVTTRKMDSFTVFRGKDPAGGLGITQEISTPVHLVYPIVKDLPKHKEAFLAGVVREAQALDVAKGSAEDLSRMLGRTMDEEERNQMFLGGLKDVSLKDLPIRETAAHLAHTAFVNQLITAIHAVRYDPQTDGDVSRYTIRTNKILLISNAMATVADSLPALIEQNPMKLDYAGIIATCLSLFSSTKFWVETKTNYLVSAYKEKIDVEMQRLDRYFVVE